MSSIEQFDFDGFDNSYVKLDTKHGPLVQSHRFILWLGWSKSSDVRRDHLQPGDEVVLEDRGEISPRSDQPKRRGAVTTSPRYLTKRGVRRLLFRSNHPRAVEYTDKILDLLDLVDEAERVGIDVVEELKGRIRELESDLKMHEISAEGEEARGRKQFLNGVRAGRNNPDLDYHAIYEGRFVKWEQADEDEDVLL